VNAKIVKTAPEWEFSDCSVWVGEVEDFAGRLIREAWFKDGGEYLRSLGEYQTVGKRFDEP
jgi:hypothetical protein